MKQTYVFALSLICGTRHSFDEDFALRVPQFHSRGTVRLTLMVPSISERWYWYQASEMSAVKRCSITDVA